MPALTLARIEELAARGESEFLELKQSTAQLREAAQTICGMLNRPQPNGRYVLFGVAPDGTPVGQQVGERTIEQVAAEIREIRPQVSPRVDRVPVADGREVIAVAVPAADKPPYTYKHRPYRRVGNTTSVMPEAEYQRILIERAHQEDARWENQPAEGWSIDELDAARIRNIIELARQCGRLDTPDDDPARLLRGLGLYTNGVLQKSAVVLFGKTKQITARMSQCLLRVARFRGSRGTAHSEFLDNRQFRGNAFELLEHAERFLSENVSISSKIGEDHMQRLDEPLYPLAAIREALVNALCHRDYSIAGGSIGIAVYNNRLEVTSTGSLPFGLTPQGLLEMPVSKPWNPSIARAFFCCGYFENWGQGIEKMAKLAVNAGLPRPEILDENGCVTVRFRNDRRTTQHSATDDRKQAVLSLLKRVDDNGLSKREIQDRLVPPASERQVRRALEELKKEKLVTYTQSGPAARWRLLSDAERQRLVVERAVGFDDDDIPF